MKVDNITHIVTKFRDSTSINSNVNCVRSCRDVAGNFYCTIETETDILRFRKNSNRRPRAFKTLEVPPETIEIVAIKMRGKTIKIMPRTESAA